MIAVSDDSAITIIITVNRYHDSDSDERYCSELEGLAKLLLPVSVRGLLAAKEVL